MLKKIANTRLVSLLILFTFLLLLTNNLVHPVTPALIAYRQFPVEYFGYFFAVMSLFGFISSPYLGAWSDRYGRERFILIGGLLYALSQALFAFAPNPWVVMLARGISGFAGFASITFCSAYAADISSKAQRGKVISFVSGSKFLGGSVGNGIGGFVGAWGEEKFGSRGFMAPFAMQVFCSSAVGIGFYLLFKKMAKYKPQAQVTEDASTTKSLPHVKQAPSELSKWQLLRSSPGLLIFLSATAMLSIGLNATQISLPFYLSQEFDLRPDRIGVFMLASGLASFISNFILNPFLANYLKDEIKVITYTPLLAVFLGAWLITGQVTILLVLFFVLSLFSSMILPTVEAFVSKRGSGQYGTILGLNQSFWALGMIIGALLSGKLFSLNASLPFLMAIISYALAIALYLYALFIHPRR